MRETYDAVVVGSGPNGLAAAVELARRGASVCVIEASDEFGGGTRSGELTLPGFVHDKCSACHPLGILSPYFRTLPLEEHGLRWIQPPASVAQPLDDQPAVLMYTSLDATAENLGPDGAAWKRLVEPFLGDPHGLLADMLAPLGVPKHPFLMARLGLSAVRSAVGLARSKFRDTRAQALFGGCAAHSILPLDMPLSAAVGMVFAISGHVEAWPVAAGGSANIPKALIAYLKTLGGELVHSTRITHPNDLPKSRVVLFDTDPFQLADICEPILPRGYLRRLRNYKFGPGVFKVDWALDGPIPWKDPRCLEASTVHTGGTLEQMAVSERAAWDGKHCDAPFVMVCQQSQFDDSRAPDGKHTGYAYCHVPSGSTRDMTDVIESQIERFAPGFRECILGRHTTSPTEFFQNNPNYVGGAIAGGAAYAPQLFTRPVARIDPYSTPNPRVFICSASTPPGGGVHGMCGYYAAVSAHKRMSRLEPAPLMN